MDMDMATLQAIRKYAHPLPFFVKPHKLFQASASISVMLTGA